MTVGHGRSLASDWLALIMSVSFNRLVPVNMNNVADRQAATNMWELGVLYSIVDD